MNETTAVQRDKLMQDLRVVIRDAETLMKTTGEQLGDGATEWRERAGNRVDDLRRQLSQLQAQTTERVAAAGRNANEFVQRNPWTAVGVASGVGLLAGYLMNNRR